MKLPLKEFFRLPIIFPVPAGIVPDAAAVYGLFGLMQNANTYASELESMATAGTSFNIIGGAVADGVIQLNAGASGPFIANLPATSAIFAALGNTIPFDGSFYKHLYIINNLTGQPGVLTAGDANTQIVGSASLGSNVTRCYIMQVLNSSNISITNIGQMPL